MWCGVRWGCMGAQRLGQRHTLRTHLLSWHCSPSGGGRCPCAAWQGEGGHGLPSGRVELGARLLHLIGKLGVGPQGLVAHCAPRVLHGLLEVPHCDLWHRVKGLLCSALGSCSSLALHQLLNGLPERGEEGRGGEGGASVCGAARGQTLSFRARVLPAACCLLPSRGAPLTQWPSWLPSGRCH